MGTRPSSIYQFVEPLLGKDNLQVYDAERGKIMRRFLAPAFGHQGNPFHALQIVMQLFL
jgi:hypothetical protein